MSSAALVLGSGGARAAYEIGVARFLFEDLSRESGQPADLGILCGTSAGALNALALAAFADRPLDGVAFLAHRWMELRLEAAIRVRKLRALQLAVGLLGCPPRPTRALETAGAVLDARPFRDQIARLPLHRVAEHLRAGRLEALSFTATEVATGRTVVFVHKSGAPPRPSNRATQLVSGVDVRPEHALASAAIPLLFPPVRIGGRAYCDGSLRQGVPLSPALHLGATRIVVVSTQHCPPRVSPSLERERESASASPLYLIGKAVNALTLDRVDEDLERLATINQLLEAGTRAYGADFLSKLNRELEPMGGRPVRPVRTVLVRPSESLGRMAADYVRSRLFRDRVGGSIRRLFERLVSGESEHEADLLSYLLFDGPFAGELIELGYADARSQRAELRDLLTEAPCSRAAGASF
jgi:NTE family protein